MHLRLIPAYWLFIFSLAAVAETPEDVYQVEIIIFERAHGTPTNDDEVWPKNLELKYPKRWVRLMSDADAEQLKRENAAIQTDEFSLSQDFLQSLGNTGETDRKAAPQTPSQTMSQPVASAESAHDLALNQPTYFRFLKDNQKTLSDSRKGLDRLGNLRILFHETWLQPMKNADQAEALIIHAGNEFGEHRELEGYIVLSLSRYLHIQTQLWFSEFVPNYGQASPHWPPLPISPKGIRSADAPFELRSEMIDLDTSNSVGLARFSELSSELQPFVSDENSYSELLQEAYITNEITVLQQKRRMRSRELHYIDHPRIGLLIKFVPYKPTITNAAKP